MPESHSETSLGLSPMALASRSMSSVPDSSSASGIKLVAYPLSFIGTVITRGIAVLKLFKHIGTIATWLGKF